MGLDLYQCSFYRENPQGIQVVGVKAVRGRNMSVGLDVTTHVLDSVWKGKNQQNVTLSVVQVCENDEGKKYVLPFGVTS